MSRRTFEHDRREFLRQLGIVTVGAPLATAIATARTGDAAPVLGASAPTRPPLAAAAAFKISLAEWSFHRRLSGRQEPKLDHLDFAITAKRDFGIEAVEYVNRFFKDKAAEPSHLADLKKRADDNGVRSVLIMVDHEGELGAADTAKRLEAVDNHKKWVDAAKFLGCHSVRVNAFSAGTPDEQRDRVADGLHKLTEYAAPAEINIIVENHGGLSSNGVWLASVMKQVNNLRCGTLPDFGNWDLEAAWGLSADAKTAKVYDRYKGVAEMMPFAKGVSAKSYDFDANGNETSTDYFKMLRIVVAAGYHGHLGIEYEGDRLSEVDGVRATKTLLERVRNGMS
jgi:sugar phosphate isomerase/epimerase